MAQFQEEKSARKLGVLRKKEEEEVAKLLARRYQIPYIDLAIFAIELDALKILPEASARTGNMAVIRTAGKHLTIAIHHPDKAETQTILNRLKEDDYTYELYFASQGSLDHAWELYKKVPESHATTAGSLQIAHDRIEELEKQFTDIEQVKASIIHSSTIRTSDILETILGGALSTEASDVHIEPQQDGIRLRYRLDGVLHDILIIPPKIYNLLLSRIKLVSELKLNIHDRAQDGRFTIHTQTVDIEVRTSTLPGPNGENIVLRILNPKSIQVKFDELGMQPWVIKAMNAELNRPNGMILTTGPTGSGKTTTLYTFLRYIYNPTIKIITIEDPIEYHLSGLEQTQVDAEKGYDFANGLRSIVRQDPDVILVGEIRDLETAETAMHAALTGHLVFSTLHTNDAAGTIPRLLDLGVKPAIIAPAMNVSMAQRLVRRVCASCRVLTPFTNEQRQKIQQQLDQFPKGMPIPPPDQWTVYAPNKNGCQACNHTGYKGRIGVFELIFIDDSMEQLIMKMPSELEIKKGAAQQGQISMMQDGILKILAGTTDIDEVERILGKIGE